MLRFHGNSKYANVQKYFHLQTFPFVGFILYLCIKLDVSKTRRHVGQAFVKT